MKKTRAGILSLSALAACIQLAFAPAPAWSNPLGPQVISGTVSMQRPSTSVLNVTNSPGAIINWQGFSIASGELTRFVQQSANSAVLNRVVGSDISRLNGQLQSNGSVFLINPAGIVMGAGSVINTQSFIGSTLAMLDSDFMNGRLRFQGDSSSGSIINQGLIRSGDAGRVILLAPSIENHGLIQTPRGELILAAGKSISITSAAHDGVLFEVQAPSDSVLNMGSLQADGGAVGLFAGTLKTGGEIRASSMGIDATGQIVLRAQGGITLDAGSVTSASGAIQGGSISIGGDVVINTARIDASGGVGGSVAINARNYLGAGVISADGTTGAAGQVDLRTTGRIIQTVAEQISVKGAGDGGKIVVAAGERLFSSATIDASGQRGGEINLLATEIMLFGARLDASGASAGGTVLIGGDYQGKNPAIPNARQTWINYSTTIDADAKTAGDGGKVIVWSDSDTRFAGNISARGGAQCGNGGFIEVSGKDSLIFAGGADAGAPNGAPGTVLLDPKNIIIDSAGGGGGLTSFVLVDPNPSSGDGFAQKILVLPNDNVVATDPNDDFAATNAGAVYLFNGTTGALISSLQGSQAGDRVGLSGLVALTNGNFVVGSRQWSNGGQAAAGAITFGSGTSGVSGAVSTANSLVGTTANDQIGSIGGGDIGVTALSNGNYVVTSSGWTNAGATNAGAVTWVNGTNGFAFGETSPGAAISTANSLVGTATGDSVGNTSLVTVLANGNYVVSSQGWAGTAANVGAVTWGNGLVGGTVGAVSAANSLVGTAAFDGVGGGGVTALTNGNYVVSSPGWDGAAVDVGAVTWGNGLGGTVGPVSVTNSLVGTTVTDVVGSGGVTALTNGNYVLSSPNWTNTGTGFGFAGAVTWGDGSTTGPRLVGAVTALNSLVGATTGPDQVGIGGVRALTNGNYVAISKNWDGSRGAVTWGNGTTGISGAVSIANSLVGSTSGDLVGGGSGTNEGGVTALTNGNYVVSSPRWDGAAADVGAVTWGNGLGGTVGAVTALNSLVGSTSVDAVGFGLGNVLVPGVTALSNGNYVVISPYWNNAAVSDAGAVTWGDGSTAGPRLVGAVTASNSLVGTTANDNVGSGGVRALFNGNYVVMSPFWDNSAVADAGAATFGSGTTGVTGAVSAANSLVGTVASEAVGGGNFGVTALTNGNYVVFSFANNGAVTFGSGTTGVTGAVSAANSLVGTTAGDSVGGDGVTVLANGNYVVRSPNWDNGAVANVGAVTFGSGTTGISGPVSIANSLVGTAANDQMGQIGDGSVTPLSNGSVVVSNPLADNGNTNTGLVQVFSPPGGGGFTNPLNFADNAAGTTTVTPAQITALTNGGTSVILQANNDITLVGSSAITTTATGTAGNITLQAGRSVILNSSITTANGNLTITANDPAATALNRDAGAGGITMATGTTLNAGTGTIALTVGSGVSGAASGNLVLENITAANVNLQQNGLTSGSSILRASSSSLITATNLLMEIDLGSLASGGSIGTLAAPMRVQASTLEAHTHQASPGIFIESLNAGNLQIGGVPFFFGSVKGVQNVTSGDIVIAVNGTLTTQAPFTAAPACGSFGGPVCTTSGNITLRADDMNLGFSVQTGNGTVALTPFTSSGHSINIGALGGLSLGLSELQQITANTLEIGRSTDIGILNLASGIGSADINAATLKLAHQNIVLSAAIDFSAGGENLTLTSGNLTTLASNINLGGTTGTPATLTLNGPTTWNAGSTLAGAGATASFVSVPSGSSLAIADAGSHALNSLTLNNAGTVNWTSGNIDLLGAAIVNNQSGANWNILTTGAGDDVSGAGTFNNLAGGTVVANAPGGSNSIHPTTVNHAGTLNLLQGDLDFGGNMTMNFTGTTVFSNGTSLKLYALAGTPTVNFGSGATFAVSSGSADFPLDSAILVNVNAAFTLPANMTLTQSLGTLTLNAPLTLASGSTYALSGGSVANAAGILTNQGTLNLNGGAIAGTLVNQGTVNLSTGSASIGAGMTQQSGFVNVASGQTLTVGGAGMDWQGGSLQGSNVASYSLASLNFSGSGSRVLNGPTFSLNNLSVPAGSFDIQAGQLNLSGTTSIASGATFIYSGGNVNPAGPIVNNGALNLSGSSLLGFGSTGGLTNNGSVTLSGTSSIRLQDTGSGYPSFINSLGAVLDINSSAGWSFFSDAGQGGILSNAGTINVNNSTSWEAAFTNAASGNLNIAAGKYVSMQNGQTIAGTVSLGAGSTLWVSERHGVNADFNATTITGTGTVQVVAGVGPVADFTNVSAPSAKLLVGSGGTANILAGSTTFGNVDITGGLLSGAGTLNVSASLNQSGGSLSGSGATLLGLGTTSTLGTVAVNRDLTNQGSLALNGTTLSNLLTNSGAVTVSGNANANAGIQQTAGTLDVTAGQTLGVGGIGLQMTGGTLKGGGTVVGNVDNQAGIVAPGASPGILTITGNYTQGPSGTLAVEIAGTSPGTQYDQLIVSGTAALDGNLNVSLLSGFVPASGNTFSVVQAGTVSGTFASTSLPASLTSLYSPTAFALEGSGASPSAVGPPMDTASLILDLNNLYFVTTLSTSDDPEGDNPLRRESQICR